MHYCVTQVVQHEFNQTCEKDCPYKMIIVCVFVQNLIKKIDNFGCQQFILKNLPNFTFFFQLYIIRLFLEAQWFIAHSHRNKKCLYLCKI